MNNRNQNKNNSYEKTASNYLSNKAKYFTNEELGCMTFLIESFTTVYIKDDCKDYDRILNFVKSYIDDQSDVARLHRHLTMVAVVFTNLCLFAAEINDDKLGQSCWDAVRYINKYMFENAVSDEEYNNFTKIVP